MKWPTRCHAIFLLAFTTVALPADRPVPEPQLLTFAGPSAPYRMGVYSNRDLTRDAPATTLAIVIQHGNGRNAVAYFSMVERLVAETGRAREDGDEILAPAPPSPQGAERAGVRRCPCRQSRLALEAG